MLIRRSLNLTLDNIQLVFKVLLYALIICFIVGAVFITVADPVLKAIGEEIDLIEISEHFLDDIFEGDGVIFDRLNSSVNHFVDTHQSELVTILVISLIAFFILKLLFALIVCPSAYILNTKMSTNFTEGFFHSVMKVGWKGVMTALVYTLISAPLDILILALSYFLGKWLVQGIGLFGIIFAVSIGIVLLTIRMSIMGQWVAVLVNENIKFSLQFKRGFRQGFKGMATIFPAMLALNIIVFGIVATTLIPTVVIIPVVMVPVALVAFVSIHLTQYYTYNSKSSY